MLPDILVEGEKIKLRKLKREDLPRIVKWLNDPEVCKGLGRKPGMTLKQEEIWYIKVTNDDSIIVFAVENPDGEHVGNITLNRIDKHHNHALLTLAFGRNYWGKGYAKDATEVLIKYAFDVMKLHKVYGRFLMHNEKSIKLFEHLGFEREGILRDEMLLEDGYHDMLLMSIINTK